MKFNIFGVDHMYTLKRVMEQKGDTAQSGKSCRLFCKVINVTVTRETACTVGI